MTTQLDMKRAVAEAAIDLVDASEVLGVGGGSTVATFVRALGDSGVRPKAAVAASSETARALSALGVPVVTLAEAGGIIPLHIDGADEIDPLGRLIKGAGGAHTMEKRLATAAEQFVCIADESKLVATLGERAPVPLEVLESELAAVIALVQPMGGTACIRVGQQADSGNPIVDISGLDLSDPVRAERDLDALPGVVECGIFALRRADLALIGEADGSVRTVEFAFI